MTANEPVGIGVVGCGMISRNYLEHLSRFPDVRVVSCADIEPAHAAAVADEFDIVASPTVESLFCRSDVEIVLNLTTPAAHFEVAKAALEAGKHVYGEKPLALDRAQGRSLVELARTVGRRLGNGPDTFLGPGLQTCQRLIEAGTIGTPVSAMAVNQDGGPNSWHPRPEFFFQRGGGPLLDFGPYYLTTLVQMCGPLSLVAAAHRIAQPERVIGAGPRAGATFKVEVPTHVGAVLEFSDGAMASLTLSFDSHAARRGFIEVVGTEATLALPDPNTFDGPIRLLRAGKEEWEDLPLRGASAGRGVGVLDMARAIRTGADHRASGELALHVLDAMTSIAESGDTGAFVGTTTTCKSPTVLPDDWNPYERLI